MQLHFYFNNNKKYFLQFYLIRGKLFYENFNLNFILYF